MLGAPGAGDVGSSPTMTVWGSRIPYKAASRVPGAGLNWT